VRQILPVRSIEQKVGMGMDLDCKRLLLNAPPSGTNGRRLLKLTLGTLASFVVFLLGASSTTAATLNVVGGQLLGASGVIVGGSSYDVAFIDGTCIALYNGCDSISDFTFQSHDAAVLASQALLDQVFLDVGAGVFDSVPNLTTGCEADPVECRAMTPYEASSTSLLVSVAHNTVNPSQDAAFTNFFDRFHDTSGVYTFETYAVWTPTPEPGTAVLVALGLAGLSGRRRRED